MFKKRHFVSIIKWTAAYLTRYFGYKRQPYVFETSNEDGVQMCICESEEKRYYAIFYDYMHFKRAYGELDFDGQEAYAMFIMAHEMRHYYQLRQMNSSKADEPEERLKLWRENRENKKSVGEDCTVLEFFMQPMELDACLFAYVFVASKLDILMLLDEIDENYINELEKYYVELFGETDEELFPKRKSAEH